MENIEAILFDVFGTVVDWHGTVSRYVQQRAEALGVRQDCKVWEAFAEEWRLDYVRLTGQIAAGEEGPLNVDLLHRQILDGMLASSRWEYLGSRLDERDRCELNLVWHHLDGWPDSSRGLHAMKKHKIIATLSNGNVRLLVDMARHADLPWDVIFSGELLGAYKPNPKTYLGAAHHLSLPPSKCLMVAAHISDLRAAAEHGMKTVYVRRPAEDRGEVKMSVKARTEGGEVDWVVNNLEELAEICAAARSGVEV